MKKDVFGKEGDFITSPEISQMFGEVCNAVVFASKDRERVYCLVGVVLHIWDSI